MQSRLNTRIIVMLSVVAVVGASGTAVARSPVDKIPMPRFDRELQIGVGPCDSPSSDILFTFNSEVITREAMAEGAPARVTFDPPLAGHFEWRSPSSLAFLPAPGALGWGHRVTAIITGLESVDGRFALSQTWRRPPAL